MKYRSLATGVALFASIGTFLVFTSGLMAERQKGEVAEKRKVVFLTGDDWGHASGTHEFYAGGMLLKHCLLEAGYADKVEAIVVHNWPEDTSVFDDADMIVHYYRGNKYHFMNANHGFIDALAKQGVSQMFIHFGVDPGAEAEPALKSWTGGVYKDKFSSNPHWLLSAQLEKHPINRGVEAYDSQDEWYVKMEYASDLQIDYASPEKVGEVYSVMHGKGPALQKAGKLKRAVGAQPSKQDLTVFWATERKDGGRGIGITGAHFHKNWANNSFRKQVLNAIVWGLRLPVPEKGVEGPEVNEEMINQNLDKRKKKYRKITL